MLTRENIRVLVQQYGGDVIEHPNMDIERRSIQHGDVTTFDHSIRVACDAVFYADRLKLWDEVDLRTLVRASLLHDYFLYDWHDWDDGAHRLHGFTHPTTALHNARRDFELNNIESDAILNHMFPLTPVTPHSVEGLLLGLSDKVSATNETITPRVALAMSRLLRANAVHGTEPLDESIILTLNGEAEHHVC